MLKKYYFCVELYFIFIIHEKSFSPLVASNFEGLA